MTAASAIRTNLVIAGAQKAATTTLFDLLARSDEVVAAKPKEPHFFSTVDNWRSRLDEYHRIYRGQAGTIRCEASTSYTFFPHRRVGLWDDLREYNPAMKIIYVIRKPTERVLSHYRHSVRRGYTRAGVEGFVRDYPLAMAICRYHTQIRPFIETFGRDNVMLLTFEDVVAQQDETLARITRFAGLPQASLARAGEVHANRSEDIRHHRLRALGALGGVIDALGARRRAARAAAAEMPAEMAQAILRELEPEVAAMERLMDRDLGAWRAP